MMEEMERVEESRPRGSLDIVESSVLGTIIPLASELNIEEALSGSVERLDEGNFSPLAGIPHRHALFFDETISIYVVLQIPYFDENALRTYLARLVINVEAQVVNAQPESHEGLPTQETIYTGTVHDSEEPLIVVQGLDESENAGHILVVWKLTAFLARPRLRLQNPSVVFSATASLKSETQVESGAITEEYLPSQIPSGMNLLEAFTGDTAMGGIKARLSALRVSEVRPVTQAARELLRPLKNISKRSVKIYPAINARVRYSLTSTTSTTNSVMASLDIDITPFANCKITVEQVKLSIDGGSVEDLNIISGMTLPITCLPQDEITFLYRLAADHTDTTIKSLVRNLNISIIATAQLTDVCRPTIVMKWTTHLDFTPPVNPGYGLPTQAIKRPHRPAHLSIGSAVEAPTVLTLANTRPDALPSVDITTRQTRNSNVPDFGVTMTFASPAADIPIYPGIPFTWSVFIVNRSDRSRKLAITVVPKRRRQETRMTRPPSVGKKDPKIADAVVDDNIVHAMQKNSAIEPTDIVCLSTDTRVGPLLPLACHEVELRFMALKEGIVDVEAVRIVDLGSQEHVDIKDLPSIVVSPLP